MRRDLPPITSTSASDAVYQRLRDGILSGTFQPGERLVERELAQQLRVSHIPIREALKMLARDGLIQYTPFKGAQVINLTPEELQDFYEVRAVLEGFAARLAADRISPDELEELRALMKQAYELANEGNVPELARINLQFHEAIARSTRNHVLMNFLERIRNQIHFFMLQSLGVSGRPSQTLQEHEAVLGALVDRDGDRAEQAASQHVLAACRAAQAAKSPVRA
ncbi:MAG: GntR family transcriptional regulator [Bacillota bacterium]